MLTEICAAVFRRAVMKQIHQGAKGSFNLLVQPEHLANRFKDATLPPVLATPVMIMAMENAALNAVRPYLDSGESAVGTAVNVRHLAATPLGRLVTAEAEVTKVEGRQIEFIVQAQDGVKEIGAGSHSRAVIDMAKFMQRLG
jgi:fluoroacetyl-CoA thioesterase